MATNTLDTEAAVRARYSAAAHLAEPALCCPVRYDERLLSVIPAEVIEKDYGCGDPSAHVRPGETVLDLGSGGGKICFIASQIVGAEGRVVGIDSNDEMLSLARRNQPEVARSVGFDNVEFRRGRIQDLRLDLDLLDAYLRSNPASTGSDWLRVAEQAEQLRNTSPLVADDSIDVVISNCVLNLVRTADRGDLFREVYRVLRRGGRAVISDIVSDEDVPLELQGDPRLWSGCISGAYREDALLDAFVAAGFYGVELLQRQSEPWAVVEGIEFRSVTVRAFKGKEGPCLDRRQAVIYNGPWRAVEDDDGNRLVRGRRTAVCDKTYNIYTRSPYDAHLTPVPPAVLDPIEEARPFDCQSNLVRSPRETKAGGLEFPAGQLAAGDCCGGGRC